VHSSDRGNASLRKSKDSRKLLEMVKVHDQLDGCHTFKRFSDDSGLRNNDVKNLEFALNDLVTHCQE
jgi:hypothetical protein